MTYKVSELKINMFMQVFHIGFTFLLRNGQNDMKSLVGYICYIHILIEKV